MELNFCTLFDHRYLEKALVLHDSLQEVCDEYTLYVLAMDEKCRTVLEDLKLRNVVVIAYDDFEDDDIKYAKGTRKYAEFCWCCTAKLIKYVLDNYDVTMATYIDADMKFYRNPSALIQEMLDKRQTVQIVKHNFRKFERKEKEKESGKYCVEFNTFCDEEKSRIVLDEWISDCIRDTSYDPQRGVLGDQMYLEGWPDKFNCVNVSENLGGGVALWNLNRFLWRADGNGYMLTDEDSGKAYPLIFYHFQSVVDMDENSMWACRADEKIFEEAFELYRNYLVDIRKKRKFLQETYGIENRIAKHPAYENNDFVDETNGMVKKKISGVRDFLSRIIGRLEYEIINYRYYRHYVEIIIHFNMTEQDDKELNLRKFKGL